jgi:cytochrome c-type biogenesis protein
MVAMKPFLFLFLLTQANLANAFTSSPSLTEPRTRIESPTALNVFNLEEMLYNAQAAASDLASLSLEDPSNLMASMPIMYGAGLLTSFSPCVWGLLPLTMSYISQAAGEREDQEAMLPTLAFAAGLAAVFCTLGVAVATLGGVFGGTAGNSVILPLVSNAICWAMGLQLLGFVELPLPSFSLSDKAAASNSDEPILLDGTGQILNSKGGHKNEASLFRTFLLGGSSAVVASPCATPVLTSILAYVAGAQNGAVGALLLLGYTLGYSTPLLLVASTGGQALVKLRELGSSDKTSIYAQIAPWVTPLTGGVLLWYGTSGLLVTMFGDPSLAGLAPVLE